MVYWVLKYFSWQAYVLTAEAETGGNKYMFSNELSEPNSVPNSECYKLGVSMFKLETNPLVFID